MKVAVITPVGPGHESVYVECQKSIASAWAKNQGPFKDLILIKYKEPPHKHQKCGKSSKKYLKILKN